ncbi:MAG: hypothetical protein VX278_00590 [Myxococcota bacterium]|nr:hypothetical protein [Myxococcota bacterium]
MIVFLLVVACSTESKVRDTSVSPVFVENDDISVDVIPELSNAESTDAESVPIRDRRRMNLFQLDRAIEEVTGYDYPDFWKANGSLGQPDYQEIIKEVREPELFFQKFLQDAAHLNCDILLNKEEESTPEERRFLRYIDVGETDEDAVKENLAYLLLLFHGHRYATEHTQIERWFSLFTEIQQNTEDAQVTWKAICVALIRHPDFYSY